MLMYKKLINYKVKKNYRYSGDRLVCQEHKSIELNDLAVFFGMQTD